MNQNLMSEYQKNPFLLREDTDPWEQYFVEKEADAQTKAYAWETGIGLQAVDQLKTSGYLSQVARRNIDGEINMDDAKRLLSQYYEENKDHLPERTQEADIVASRIAEILSENAFVFSPIQYLSIHQRLFEGILPNAGQMRTYNISKEEWVLNGKSILYGSAAELKATLEYDFQTEREFNYAGMSMPEIISHLARFISRLWQIHVFSEGNTRTTAVFFIKYLRSLGFAVTNDIFARNAWYFRNALVRVNYTDLGRGMRDDTVYLELFLENLLLGEKNELRNRYLHIDWKEDEKTASYTQKQHIKQHFKQPGAEPNSLLNILKASSVSERSSENILKLYHQFGNNRIFSRQDIMRVLNITERPAAALMKKMRDLEIVERVSGAGNGRYHFALVEK